jgi:hypothetical protein
MFVRRRVVKGQDYYAVVESYRDGARVRHRQIVALGTFPDVPTAIAATRREVHRLRYRVTRLRSFEYPLVMRECEASTKRLALQQARLILLEDALARMPSPETPVQQPPPSPEMSSPEVPVQQPPPSPRGRRFRL